MSHIFISYSRRNLDLAQKIVDALAANNLDTWIDWKSIPKGEDWEQEIYRGIEEADAFLFLISPDSVTSEMCNKEIAHAVKNGKRILPIIIYDTDPKIIHPEISKRNWVSCRAGQDDFIRAIEETHRTIHTDYEWLRYHTKLQVKALDWERTKDIGRLLRGKELREAKRRVQEGEGKDPQLTNKQIEYVTASITFRRRMRMGVTIACIACILAIFSLYIKYYSESSRANLETNQRKAAEKAESEAKAIQIASQAENMLLGNGDVVEAAKLILESGQASLTSAEVKHTVYLLSTLPLPDMILKDPGREISDTDYLLQKDLVLTVGIDNGRAILWNAKDGSRLYSLPITRISSAHFSYDGKQIITTDWGDKIRVWSTDFGSPLYSIDGYGGKLDRSSFSRISPYVVYPCEIHFVCVLNYDNGELQQKIDAQMDRVTFAGFGSDNSLIVAAGENQKINVFDVDSGALSNSMTGESCGAAALSSHGYLLACADYGGKVTVWDYRSGEQTALFENLNLRRNGEGLARGSLSLSFSPAGNTIGMTTVNGEAILLDIGGNSQIKLETGDVTALDFNADGKKIITGHLDGTARTWNVTSGKELVKLQSHQGVVLSAHFISESNKVVTTSVDGTARIWNLTPLNLSGRISTGAFISRSKFSHAGRTIALVTSGNAVLIWDIKNDKNLFVLEGHADDIVSIDFSPDDKYLVSASRDNTFEIWDLSNGQAIKTINWHKDDVLSAKFSPDGKKIASVGLDHRAGLWDARTGNLIHEFTGHEIGIFDVEFSNDGSELLTIDYSGIIGQWSVSTGKPIRFYEMKAKGVDSAFTLGYESMTFSQDGSKIAAVGKDNVARVWAADTGKQVSMFWNDPGFTAALFSPDGNRIATYGDDSVIRIWNISSGSMDMELIGHTGESDTLISAGLVSAQFSQSGNEIISIGEDATLRIWDLTKGQNLVILPIASTFAASISNDSLKVGAYDLFGNFSILNIDYGEIVDLLKLRLEALGNIESSVEQ